jgi:glucokinase
MSGETYRMGVDLGGTNIKFCVVGEDGAIRARHRVGTPSRDGCEGIIDVIVANIRVMLAAAEVKLVQLHSIGLGVPGTVDPQKGVVVFAPNVFAVNLEIVKMIQAHYDVPIHLAQDSQAAAWAEYVVGAGKGLPSLATITLGTGIGCGLVIDGRIYHGSLNHTAGELGHQIVDFGGSECNCGRRGCLETQAGGLAIVRDAQKSIEGLSDLLGRSAESISVKDVFELAGRGNDQARRITSNVVKYLGIGLVNLINIVSPALITVSGGICDAPPELLFNPLVVFVREHAYPTLADAIRICRSPLGSDAPLIGVANLHRQPDVCAAPTG